MAVEIISLGHPITLHDPNPPAIPAPEISQLYSIAADAANVFILKIALHSGTHVDAPAHVIESGLHITDFSPPELIYTRPVVVDLKLNDAQIVEPEHLRPAIEAGKAADLLLLRFGYGPARREEPQRFRERCPGLGVAAAEYLRAALPGLRALGMDVPSLACIAHLEQTMSVHNVLLEGEGRRFLVIEDMNLEQDLRGLQRVILAPWQVAGVDSTPCTIFGERQID
jgi:kynurenine formamidase